MTGWNEAAMEAARKKASAAVTAGAPRVRQATVTGVAPLQIRYDTEPAPSRAVPASVVRPQVGDRVEVIKYKGRALIIGVLGGGGTDWVLLAMEPGFVSYAGFGHAPQVRKDPSGVVRLRGTVSPTVGSFTAPAQHLIATIPAGFNPSGLETWVGGAGISGGQGFCRVESRTNGDLYITPQQGHTWVDISHTYWN